MDYEEKYKEALEKCRWMLANDKISKKSATELFRELKEITDIEIIEMISSIIASIQFPDDGMPMQMACLKWLEKQGEPRVDMIQWKGDNLREVLEFTGKNKNFDKWFASFEEFEEYVHEHNDIFKIFNDDDGSHCEVPVGAWIVKTPDGYNVPSKAKYKQKIEQKPAWSEEDERIRKSLIESYTNQHPSNFPTVDGFTREQILAWLEKQGEQKSITFNDDRIIDSALNDYCCKQYNALDKENGGVLSFARLQHLAMDIYGWCKKQGEQKPADKFEPVFKVDWSLHELKLFDDIIAAVELDNGIGDERKKEIVHLLNTCRLIHKEPIPTPMVANKQKPVEWSEEDEKHLSWLIEHLGQSAGLYDNLIGWLKSLKDRCTWEPSLEQMAALAETINYFAKKDAPHYNDYLFNVLKGLKQGLKKLM